MSNHQERTKILLGVTGSVAAVKAPEIAVRLVEDSAGYAVKVVLTQGGRHFWDQSKNYKPEIWERFVKCLERESEKKEPGLTVLGTYTRDEGTLSFVIKLHICGGAVC